MHGMVNQPFSLVSLLDALREFGLMNPSAYSARHMLLIIAAACLLMPLALTAGTGKASPTSQTPPPTPVPPAPHEPVPALYCPETGHNLSVKFLDYWQSHGGLPIHGYPITEPTMEKSTNGKQYLVQWFERSRLELHPENAGSEYEVLLGVLGRQLSEKRGYPFGWYPEYGRAAD